MDKIIEVLKNSKCQLETLGTATDDINNTQIKEIDNLLRSLEKQNPSKDGFYYWTVRIGIDKTWVADGADFTDDKLHDLLTRHFRYAYSYELKGEVLSRPPDEAVAKEMGFESVEAYLKDRQE